MAFLLGTVMDLAEQQGADALHRDIIEFQKQTNPILEEMIFTQCNSGTVHKATVRTALPDVAWRMLNRGVKPDKSGRGQVSFTCGMMEALAKIDEEEVALYKDSEEYRRSEDKAFQISMNNKMAQTLFYGDEKINPAGFTGLGAYYGSLTGKSKDYIIDAGGTGDNLTSIYFVIWSQSTICGIFPVGTTAGFQYTSKGLVKAYDANQGEYYVWESQYKWKMGLAVRDYRYGVRIVNVDTAMAKDDTSALAFIDKLIDAYNRIENVSAGKAAIYCNRKASTLLDQLAQRKFNVNLGIESFGGKKIPAFWGIPIRVSDGILNTESQMV